MKDVAGNAVEVSSEAALVDLHAVHDLASNSINRLVGELERWSAAAAFEVFYDPVANRLIHLSCAIDVRIEPSKKLVEGILIEFPLSRSNGPSKQESAKAQ